MQITEEKFTILKIKKKEVNVLYTLAQPEYWTLTEPLEPSDRLAEMLMENDMYYYTKSISEKIRNREYKFLDSMKPYFDSKVDISGNGTILLDDDMTILYNIYYDVNDNDKLTIETAFLKRHVFLMYAVSKLLHGSELVINYYNTDPKIGEVFSDISQSLPVELALSHHIFRKFAPVEEYIVNKKSNRNLRINFTKYTNTSKESVKIIDSRWFRDIIKTDGFGVSGHFRLQPCGKNKTDRKLIWVNEYKKNGYTLIHKKPD